VADEVLGDPLMTPSLPVNRGGRARTCGVGGRHRVGGRGGASSPCACAGLWPRRLLLLP